MDIFSFQNYRDYIQYRIGLLLKGERGAHGRVCQGHQNRAFLFEPGFEGAVEPDL